MWVRRRSASVDAFLNRVRLGAARPGSYILTTRIPVSGPGGDHEQLKIADGEDPALTMPEGLQVATGSTPAPARAVPIPGREVSERLQNALRAAREVAYRIAERPDGAAVFEAYVDMGVSANLCKALGDLAGHSRDHPFEMDIAWARGRPSERAAGKVVFTGRMASALGRAGRELEKLAKSGDARIIGRVETLDLGKGPRPRIKVVGELRTTAQVVRRALWVIVSYADYDRAIDAQRKGQEIVVEGRLVVTRSRLEMLPSTFHALPRGR